MNVATHTIHQQKIPKKEFLRYIHNFRGIAILFVVAGHLLLNWSSDSTEYLVFRVIWENGTVLFIFIAGYLFQHLSKKFEYKNYLKKKLQNVILPYFIVSTPIIIYRIVFNDYQGSILHFHPDLPSWSIFNKITYFIFHGAHLQPLWFVPMISLFYLTAPFLIYIDRHPKLYYLLILFIAISLIVNREPFTDIPKMFVHFTSVYIFGMFMSRYKKQFIEFGKKYWLLITTLTIAVIAISLSYYILREIPAAKIQDDKYTNAITYFQKMLICVFFIYTLWKFDKYVPRFLSVLAETSFGIFFIHYYFILFLKALYEKSFKHPIPGNFFYWTIDFILVVLLTVFTIKIIQKLFPNHSRNLIGC